MKPIVIQGAMEIEVQVYVDRLSSVTVETKGEHKFYHGFFKEYPVIISQTNIGMVNATIATTLAVTQYEPVMILNQGVAGAHDTDLHVGDMVIGESAVAINSFERPFAKSGVHYQDWIATDFYNKIQPMKSDVSLVDLYDSATFKHGKKIRGVLGSGDVWNKEWEHIDWLRDHLHSSCEDMETLAVYKVGEEFSVPVLGLRIISNNERTEEAYKPEVASYLQEFILDEMPTLITWAKERENK